MSFDALAWAAKVRTKHSADKLVLLGLAENASRDDQCAFPSIAALCEFGSLNRKTVITALDRLQEAGLIKDTGKTVGRTGQIKVYRLNVENNPKNGTVKESQKRDRSQNRNSSVFTRKESQKRDTEPVREPVHLSDATHLQDSAGARKPSKQKVSVQRPDDVSDAVWRDWLAHRKTAFSETALRGFEREAAKAGWSLEQAFTEAIERGWQGFKADWVKEKRNGTADRANNPATKPADGFAAALRDVATRSDGQSGYHHTGGMRGIALPSPVTVK